MIYGGGGPSGGVALCCAALAVCRLGGGRHFAKVRLLVKGGLPREALTLLSHVCVRCVTRTISETGVGDEFHVVFQCPGQEVPQQMCAGLFDSSGGWSSRNPAVQPANAMHQFMARDVRAVASFINACDLRTQELPLDEVMFGDPCESSVGGFC
jgi:hypothetical protein